MTYEAKYKVGATYNGGMIKINRELTPRMIKTPTFILQNDYDRPYYISAVTIKQTTIKIKILSVSFNKYNEPIYSVSIKEGSFLGEQEIRYGDLTEDDINRMVTCYNSPIPIELK